MIDTYHVGEAYPPGRVDKVTLWRTPDGYFGLITPKGGHSIPFENYPSWESIKSELVRCLREDAPLPYGIIMHVDPRVGLTYSGRTAMSAYMLLCNFTDQGVRTIKDASKRRAAARELAKKLGVEIKAGYLAIGPYDLVIHVEAPNDETLATYLLSLGSKGNVRTTTLKVFPEGEFDKIVGAVT